MQLAVLGLTSDAPGRPGDRPPGQKDSHGQRSFAPTRHEQSEGTETDPAQAPQRSRNHPSQWRVPRHCQKPNPLLGEPSEAQEATALRDAKAKALDRWIQDFRAVAKVVLDERPQLLKNLGITA